jgi:hypothetical protein
VCPSGAARDRLGADHAVSAGAVLHRHRLAPGGGERLGDQPRGDVGHAARRVGHDHAHRPVGEGGGLRGGAARAEQERRRGEQRRAAADGGHGVSSGVVAGRECAWAAAAG